MGIYYLSFSNMLQHNYNDELPQFQCNQYFTFINLLRSTYLFSYPHAYWASTKYTVIDTNSGCGRYHKLFTIIANHLYKAGNVCWLTQITCMPSAIWRNRKSNVCTLVQKHTHTHIYMYIYIYIERERRIVSIIFAYFDQSSILYPYLSIILNLVIGNGWRICASSD